MTALSSTGDRPVLRGFAARTGVWYEIGPDIQEFLAVGCFKRSVEDPATDVVLNLQHGAAGSGLPLARTTAKTLKLSEITTGPQTGLFIEATLDPDDPDTQILERKLASGALDGQASFMFRIANQTWSEDYRRRTVTQANLQNGDVTACIYGANTATHVEMALRTSRPKARSAYVPDLAARNALLLMARTTRRIPLSEYTKGRSR